jgi:hypothetical protein
LRSITAAFFVSWFNFSRHLPCKLGITMTSEIAGKNGAKPPKRFQLLTVSPWSGNERLGSRLGLLQCHAVRPNFRARPCHHLPGLGDSSPTTSISTGWAFSVARAILTSIGILLAWRRLPSRVGEEGHDSSEGRNVCSCRRQHPLSGEIILKSPVSSPCFSLGTQLFHRGGKAHFSMWPFFRDRNDARTTANSKIVSVDKPLLAFPHPLSGLIAVGDFFFSQE